MEKIIECAKNIIEIIITTILIILPLPAIFLFFYSIVNTYYITNVDSTNIDIINNILNVSNTHITENDNVNKIILKSRLLTGWDIDIICDSNEEYSFYIARDDDNIWIANYLKKRQKYDIIYCISSSNFDCY